MGFFAQAHVCTDSIYFGQPSVIVYIVNIIVNDTKIIIFQQCFLSFLCKSGRKTDKAKLYIQSTINTDYLLWQKSTAKIDSFHTSMFIIFLVRTLQCTEVRFASFLSGGFITVNSPERKLEKHTSVNWFNGSLGRVICTVHSILNPALPGRIQMYHC